MAKFWEVKTQLKGDGFHFFAASVLEWKVNDDVGALVSYMKRQNFGFNLWYVPGDIERSYKIQDFVPQVDGVVWLGYYMEKR